MTGLLDAVLAFHSSGACVVPARTDGTKAPAAFWKKYQAERPDEQQLRQWFTSGTYDGFGVICGAVSGGLEMLELEGRALAEGYLQRLISALADHGLKGLGDRLAKGYAEGSPNGGVHFPYRVNGELRGNTKLASRPARDDELTDKERQILATHPGKVFPRVLVESRGEGGFVVVAPSGGRTHPTGKAWRLIAGGPATIPVITEDERDALYAIASLLDEMPAADPPPPVGGGSTARDDILRPGDDYNAKTDWADILTPHGWTHVLNFGRARGWRRPGKNRGVSATTGRNDADNLYVFTTSTEFDHEKAYSKFGAYALLEHGGDYAAAARALRAAGYGGQLPRDDDGIDDLIDDGDGGDGTPGHEAPAGAEQPPGAYTLTDDGNAQQLVDVNHATVRYVPERATWLGWDGHRWAWDIGGDIVQHARYVARNLPAGNDKDKAHKARSLSARGVEAMLRLARHDPRVRARQAALDGRPYELNTPAGPVDLHTGKLLDPDPAALHTRSAAVAPDFDTEPRRWLDFLADTFAGDPELTTYVQRLLGMSLIGTVLESVLPFGYGTGANGKTTLLDVAQRLLRVGDDGYSVAAPSDLLLARANQGHPTEIARLSGARLVVCSELDDNQRFAEAKIKLLTGKDIITGRFMRQDFFSFRPSHHLWLLGNHMPRVRDGGPAFWRRIRLIPFLHTIPPEKQDAKLADKLVAEEGPAILAWFITGAVDYLSDGITEPDAVKNATGNYQKDQDSVGRFVEECCVIGPTTRQDLCILMPKLREAYERWCGDEGDEPVGPKTFGQTLRARYGITDKKSNGRKFYLGIRLDEVKEDTPSDPAADASDPGDRRDNFDDLL